MITVNTHEAKTKFSSLMAAVENDHETILVCRNGHPVAEIHAVERPPRKALPKPNPKLAPTLKYDPVEPMTADEWPEEYQ